MKIVVVESPYRGKDFSEQYRNVQYAKRCVRDCLHRGEAPFASHLFYTQVLDDRIPEERKLGIEAGLHIMRSADATVVYVDYGISEGMKYGIETAKKLGRPIEFRKLEGQPAQVVPVKVR